MIGVFFDHCSSLFHTVPEPDPQGDKHSKTADPGTIPQMRDKKGRNF